MVRLRCEGGGLGGGRRPSVSKMYRICSTLEALAHGGRVLRGLASIIGGGVLAGAAGIVVGGGPIGGAEGPPACAQPPTVTHNPLFGYRGRMGDCRHDKLLVWRTTLVTGGRVKIGRPHLARHHTNYSKVTTFSPVEGL
eukprot:685999-Prorocentrum_minimum.AAC.4